MKKLILILFLSWCSAASAQSADEKEIVSILNQSTVAWNNGNIDEFMKDYWHNDSVKYVGKSGVTYGYNNILGNYKKYFPDTATMGKLSFDILHVNQLSPEYVFVVGKYIVTRTKGNASGYYTLLFRKINGKWVIVCDHSS
jgi:hypothetical protein